MKKKIALVSIIIPCFNKSDLIKDAVISIIHSNYKNIEILIINDGSTDKLTLKTLKELKEKFRMVRLFNTQNQGVAKARNIGLDNAKGEFVLFLDNDDLISPSYISNSINFLEEKNNRPIGFVYPDIVFFKGKYGYRVTQNYSINNLRLYNYIPISSIFCLEYLKKVRFDPRLKQLEDWDFYLKLANQKVYGTKAPGDNYLFYRILNHSRNASQKELLHRIKTKNLVLKNNGIKLTIFEKLLTVLGPLAYKLIAKKIEKRELINMEKIKVKEIPLELKNELTSVTLSNR